MTTLVKSKLVNQEDDPRTEAQREIWRRATRKYYLKHKKKVIAKTKKWKERNPEWVKVYDNTRYSRV